MTKPTHESRLAILRRYVERYRRQAGMSHESLAMLMVEAYDHLGKPPIGGDFMRHKDVFEMAKVAWQRISRWLDDSSKDKTLMPSNFESVVLYVLPADLRIQALNEMLADIGVVVRLLDVAPSSLDAVAMVASVVKEGAEATASLADLIDGATPTELRTAQQQLTESVAAQQKALADIEAALAGQPGRAA